MTHIHQEHLHSARERSLPGPATRPGFATTAAILRCWREKKAATRNDGNG